MRNDYDWPVIIGWAVGLTIVGLITWGIVAVENRERAHGRQQTEECRAAGGFAQTNPNGTLVQCNMPGGR